MKKSNLAFFGTSHYAVMILDALKRAGLSPSLIITTPDKPAGKGMQLTPPPVKIWAQQEHIEVLQPEKLKETSFLETLKARNFDLFIVVAYGKIIPQEVINISPKGVLNVHASLLPKLRGASPIETAILQDEKHTGITIMLIDSEMDHGPIIAQKEVSMDPWPPKARELGYTLVETGGQLLVEVIPQWLNGSIEAKPQDHSCATYTKKIVKEDALIDLSADPYENFRKIQAYAEWPKPYFFTEKNSPAAQAGKKIRVIIKDAEYKNDTLVIKRVIPEGKKEMDYSAFFN
ncbi:MAG: methionyl-tRNA formyltransferase [bacterium]|nr:methionyl-tRNA formyltransferase [bacterium]